MQSKGTPVYVKPSQEQLQMAFNAFDADKGGFISSKELQQILSRCGVIAEIEHCNCLVQLYGKKSKKDTTYELDLGGFSNMLAELFDLVTKESNKKIEGA